MGWGFRCDYTCCVCFDWCLVCLFMVLLSELVVLYGCCLVAGCEFCGAGADLDWFGCWCVYLVIAASLG